MPLIGMTHILDLVNAMWRSLDSRLQSRLIDFSVPQGSCAGPVLYSVYASTLQTVIPEGINLNSFADDHNVKKSFRAGNKVDEKEVISDLEMCKTRINKLDECK